MSERLEAEARKLIDLRQDYEGKRKLADKAEEKKKAQERVVYDLMSSEKQKTSTLELGPGYGDWSVGRRETIRGRIIDTDAALEAFDNEARSDEMAKVDIRKKPLNDLVRERLQTGQPLPPGVDFVRTPYIQLSRKQRRN